MEPELEDHKYEYMLNTFAKKSYIKYIKNAYDETDKEKYLNKREKIFFSKSKIKRYKIYK